MMTLLATVVVLGVLIFVHELGHFIAAKLSGIGVPRFSIGLGPRVWGVRVGETEYVVSAVPLGGYVRMAGAVEDEQALLEGGEVSEEFPPERQFSSKPLWTRAVVISAGVVMNGLFAWGALCYLSVREHPSTLPAVIGAVEPGWPAEAAGLRPNDRILAVDGERISGWSEFSSLIHERAGAQVRLRVKRGRERLELVSAVDSFPLPIRTGTDTLVIGRLGTLPDTSQASLVEALVRGTETSWRLTREVLVFLGGLLAGQRSPRDVAGVLTIGQLSGTFARAGLLEFLWFMAFLSINLAIVNLLPIPILDGGHLLFIAIEAVRGRSVSLETRVRATQVGLVLLFIIMVWALTADVLRLTGN